MPGLSSTRAGSECGPCARQPKLPFRHEEPHRLGVCHHIFVTCVDEGDGHALFNSGGGMTNEGDMRHLKLCSPSAASASSRWRAR